MRGGRRLIETGAKVGVAAVIGGVAYKAYEDWKAGKPATVEPGPVALPQPQGTAFLPDDSKSADDLAARLLSLHSQLTEVLRAYAPDTAAVEHTFVNKDAVATLKLGQARGIALLVPAQFGLTVGEYAPNAVKKTVVGVGHAAKVQVDHMVRLHLPGVKIEGPDAADALAIAICHAHHSQSAGRLQAALKRAAG